MDDPRPGVLLVKRNLPASLRGTLAERYRLLPPIDDPDPRLLAPGAAERARGLVATGSSGVPSALIAALPRLSIVCCYGSGYENVDLAAARARGIVVATGVGANAACVADMAMALLLASTRRVCAGDRFIRAGHWGSRALGAEFTARGLSGQKLGVLGLGAIGMEIARRAEPFGLRIAYHNRRPRPDVAYDHHPDALSLARWADLLVVALRADASNRHIVDAKVLAALGPEGHVINISRGSAIDEAALAHALKSGAIAGAALDVFEQEPRVHPALLEAPNVVMAPHLGGRTRVAERALTDRVLGNLDAHFAGRPAPGAVAL